MQFRECDDGEGAEGNCCRRLQWSERLDLIHVAMLLFSRLGRCPACCRGAAALWLDLGGASSGSVVKKIVRVGGWSPPNSGKRWRRAGCLCQRTRGRVLWCGGRRRSAGGNLLPVGPLLPGWGLRRRRGRFCAAGGSPRARGPESCPRTRRVSPSGAACTRPRGMSPAARTRTTFLRPAAARPPTSVRRLPPPVRLRFVSAEWPARPRRAGPRPGNGRRRAGRVSPSD